LQYYCEAVFPDLLRVHGMHIQQKCDFMVPLKDYKYQSGPLKGLRVICGSLMGRNIPSNFPVEISEVFLLCKLLYLDRLKRDGKISILIGENLAKIQSRSLQHRSLRHYNYIYLLSLSTSSSECRFLQQWLEDSCCLRCNTMCPDRFVSDIMEESAASIFRFYSEYGGRKFLSKLNTYLADYMASHARKQ